MDKKSAFLIGPNHTSPFLIKHYDHRAREVENYSIIAVKYPNIDQGIPDDALNGIFWLDDVQLVI